MLKQYVITFLVILFFTCSANADEQKVEHTCEAVGERFYCVDKDKQPLNGKIYDTWPNGEYKTIINYKEGYADGLSTYFNNEGKLMERAYYKMGVKHGMDKVYYDNRTIKIFANYKNGLLDGWQNFFTPQGRQRCKVYYKNGKLTEGYCISYAHKHRRKKSLTFEQIETVELNQLFNCEDKQ